MQFKLFIFFTLIITGIIMYRCQETEEQTFNYVSERFADVRMLRYQIPGFANLDLNKKILLYYLYEAALSGRDIFYDQNYKHNLFIRRTLENIVKHYNGDRSAVPFQQFLTYTKRVWFANGIHHHYSSDKFIPAFTREYFIELIKDSPNASFPLDGGQTVDDLINKIVPILFDPAIAARKVTLDPEVDVIKHSATNYYENVSKEDVFTFYEQFIDPNDLSPVSYGLNSKLIKANGNLVEKTWKIGGMYTGAIEKIVFWLEKAVTVAENDQQKAILEQLISYYKTGDLKTFDDYCILWVQDTLSVVDAINGFIETYGDPLGYRGAYESVVSFKDPEASERIAAISRQAQWFEDHSPIMEQHKKAQVTGISARVISVVTAAGDASPAMPLGINLPNADWIRTRYGSKSVTLGNIKEAYDEASKSSGVPEEFNYSADMTALEKKHTVLVRNVHTDLHEVIGHASGAIEPGVGTIQETLKNYCSIIEEARADLVALYYLMDPKLIEIGVIPSLDAGKVAYHRYIRRGLMTQLYRIQPGKDIQQAHMRMRQMIPGWAYEKSKADKVIEKKIKDDKTYFVINDYQKLRALFGELLREIQRIKSQGDYQAAKHLIETYGVKVNPQLHQEVIARYEKLDIAPFSGFINPILKPVKDQGEIVDIIIEYPSDFIQQMLYYAEHYSFLPTYN